MSKALGRDINEYYNKHLPSNTYVEEYGDLLEEHEDIAGNLVLPANDKFELKEFGDIYDSTDMKLGTFESYFKRWLKQQSTATIVIEVPKVDYGYWVTELRNLGLKIVK
jgi:hypothetical protein